MDPSIPCIGSDLVYYTDNNVTACDWCGGVRTCGTDLMHMAY